MSESPSVATPAGRPPGLTAPGWSTYDLLRGAAAANPDGVAVTFFEAPDAEPVSLTHRQFLARLHQAANLFHRLGIRPGRVVSLLSPTLPDAVVALWAAEAAGIANPINFLLQPDGKPGETLPPGEIGILVTRGPHVFAGYTDAEQTDKAFTPDGWLITGDLGVIDGEGCLRVTGRAKDLIIRSGHNIDPAVIEAAAAGHPAVALSAAVGLPDAYAGEVLMLYVTAKPNVDLSVPDLERHLRASVPEAPARPRQVVVLDTMPLTAIGKIAKPVVRRDAVRRAAESALGDVQRRAGVAAQADVAETAGGGLRVRVVVAGCAAADRPGVAAAVAQALARYSFAQEVSFA